MIGNGATRKCGRHAFTKMLASTRRSDDAKTQNSSPFPGKAAARVAMEISGGATAGTVHQGLQKSPEKKSRNCGQKFRNERMA